MRKLHLREIQWFTSHNAGETRVRSLAWEDLLEKRMATHSSILPWRIPWTEDLGGLQFLGLQRVWHYWATEFFTRCNATTLKCYNHGNWEEIWLHIQIFTLYLFVPMCLQTGTCWINLQGIPSGRQHQSEVIREEVVSCRTLGFRSYIPFSSVQLLSHVQLFATPWIAACQASLSITNSRSSLKPMSIVSVMPSSHLILCCPLLLLPQSLPASESFPISQLFSWSGQSTGVSALASFLP